jgi:hypothetical protein
LSGEGGGEIDVVVDVIGSERSEHFPNRLRRLGGA